MDYLIWIWVAVLFVSAAIEMLSMQLVAVWFTLSSLVTIVLALCGVVWWVQILVFCILSLVLLLSLRRISMKYLLKNNNQKTNAESIVGTHHKLLESIEPEKSGSVKVSGVVWTAILEDEDQSLEAGKFVEIVKISGNKLIVKPGKKPEKETKKDIEAPAKNINTKKNKKGEEK